MMPGLLDTTLRQGRLATGLESAASSAAADIAMKRRAEKFDAQTGLGQLAGIAAGKAIGKAKREGVTLAPETLKMLGVVSQHLFNHWLPQYDAPEAWTPEAAPAEAPSPDGMMPETGFETIPQEGPQ